ncbi:MAG: putative mycofactocin binding protein MftB [Marmoricola sp.]|nr:putative mycofactocin binding protein MftB [Marmoricola sp.]
MPVLLEESWRLSGSVSLRPEPFGAMAYDFRTRRLSFLKSPDLVAVVEALGTQPSVAGALAAAGIEEPRRPRFLRALEDLAASGMLTPAPAPVPAGGPA